MDNFVKHTYYLNADMIRFLLAENLALKTLLHDKGILTPEEFQQYQKQAIETLDQKVDQQLEHWKSTNPMIAKLMEQSPLAPQASSGQAEASAD